MNLTNKAFTVYEYKLLGYNLNFIPSQSFFNKNNVLKDIDAFGRKVKLRAHFHLQLPNKNDIERKFYATNKTWEPKNSHHTVSTFLESFKKHAIQAFDKIKPRTTIKNLSKDEENALNDLMKRTDIVICKADKGGATVIVDVKDYIIEANKQLVDERYYRKLDLDPTQTHCDLVNNTIDSMKQQDLISSKLAEGLKMQEARTPLFYLLPKIHKKGNPGRPVVSSIDCHTSRISAFVDHHLHPIVQQTKAYVRDTNDFLNKLSPHSETINDQTILVTMDVRSLYTNIPNNEGVQAVRNYLTKFNGKNHIQTNGASMGTKCAPEYANIFMAEFENKYIYPRIQGKCPLYLRYIDDIFLIWQGTFEELKKFFSEINLVHPTIKFETVYSRKQVNFLDTTVTITPQYTIKTSLYQKPTDRHAFLHHKSYHPSSTKSSLPYSQALRIKRICSSNDDYQTAITALKDQFVARGYNESLVSKEIDKASSKIREDLLKPKEPVNKPPPLTLVTTYNKSLPNIAELLDKDWYLLKINHGLSLKFPQKPMIAYRRNPNLRQLIGQHRIENGKVVKKKTKSTGKCTPCRSKQGNKCCKQVKGTSIFRNRFTKKEYRIFHNLTCKDKNVIYLLECTKCGHKAYVGKSEIPMNERINGHRSDAKRTDKLEVDTHFLEPGHNFDRDAKFTIIEQVTKKNLTRTQMTNFLMKREDFWMQKLQTIKSNGFNTGLNFPI